MVITFIVTGTMEEELLRFGLSSSRFIVIDFLAGPCTYGKIEIEDGSFSSKTLPCLWNVVFPGGFGRAADHSAHDIFVGQVSALNATTIEHVIASDVRFETVDTRRRLLIPVIVLQNHNRYNIMDKGDNYSIDVETIEAEMKMVQSGQEVVMKGGSHALHRHEKLLLLLLKQHRAILFMRPRMMDVFMFVLRHVWMEPFVKRSWNGLDMLAAGLLEVSAPISFQ